MPVPPVPHGSTPAPSPPDASDEPNWTRRSSWDEDLPQPRPGFPPPKLPSCPPANYACKSKQGFPPAKAPSEPKRPLFEGTKPESAALTRKGDVAEEEIIKTLEATAETETVVSPIPPEPPCVESGRKRRRTFVGQRRSRSWQVDHPPMPVAPEPAATSMQDDAPHAVPQPVSPEIKPLSHFARSRSSLNLSGAFGKKHARKVKSNVAYAASADAAVLTEEGTSGKQLSLDLVGAFNKSRSCNGQTNTTHAACADGACMQEERTRGHPIAKGHQVLLDDSGSAEQKHDASLNFGAAFERKSSCGPTNDSGTMGKDTSIVKALSGERENQKELKHISGDLPGDQGSAGGNHTSGSQEPQQIELQHDILKRAPETPPRQNLPEIAICSAAQHRDSDATAPSAQNYQGNRFSDNGSSLLPVAIPGAGEPPPQQCSQQQTLTGNEHPGLYQWSQQETLAVSEQTGFYQWSPQGRLYGQIKSSIINASYGFIEIYENQGVATERSLFFHINECPESVRKGKGPQRGERVSFFMEDNFDKGFRAKKLAFEDRPADVPMSTPATSANAIPIGQQQHDLGPQQSAVVGKPADGSASWNEASGSGIVSEIKFCRDFRRGICTRGDACKFSHNEAVQGEGAPGICIQFRKGICAYGDRCKFSHQSEPQVTTSEEFCQLYRRGNCTFGNKCKFSHSSIHLQNDWRCIACGDMQYARNVKCRKCGSPKECSVPSLASLGAKDSTDLFIKGFPKGWTRSELMDFLRNLDAAPCQGADNIVILPDEPGSSTRTARVNYASDFFATKACHMLSDQKIAGASVQAWVEKAQRDASSKRLDGLKNTSDTTQEIRGNSGRSAFGSESRNRSRSQRASRAGASDKNSQQLQLQSLPLPPPPSYPHPAEQQCAQQAELELMQPWLVQEQLRLAQEQNSWAEDPFAPPPSQVHPQMQHLLGDMSSVAAQHQQQMQIAQHVQMHHMQTQMYQHQLQAHMSLEQNGLHIQQPQQALVQMQHGQGHPTNVKPGEQYLFKITTCYDYSGCSGCVQGEVVTVLRTTDTGSPPVEVKWKSGVTYWVHYNDLTCLPEAQARSTALVPMPPPHPPTEQQRLEAHRLEAHAQQCWPNGFPSPPPTPPPPQTPHPSLLQHQEQHPSLSIPPPPETPHPSVLQRQEQQQELQQASMPGGNASQRKERKLRGSAAARIGTRSRERTSTRQPPSEAKPADPRQLKNGMVEAKAAAAEKQQGVPATVEVQAQSGNDLERALLDNLTAALAKQAPALNEAKPKDAPKSSPSSTTAAASEEKVANTVADSELHLQRARHVKEKQQEQILHEDMLNAREGKACIEGTESKKEKEDEERRLEAERRVAEKLAAGKAAQTQAEAAAAAAAAAEQARLQQQQEPERQQQQEQARQQQQQERLRLQQQEHARKQQQEQANQQQERLRLHQHEKARQEQQQEQARLQQQAEVEQRRAADHSITERAEPEKKCNATERVKLQRKENAGAPNGATSAVAPLTEVGQGTAGERSVPEAPGDVESITTSLTAKAQQVSVELLRTINGVTLEPEARLQLESRVLTELVCPFFPESTTLVDALVGRHRSVRRRQLQL